MKILQIADIADEISAATGAEIPAPVIIDDIHEFLETTEEELEEEGIVAPQGIVVPQGIIGGVLRKVLPPEILRNPKVKGIIRKVDGYPTQIKEIR